MRTALLALLLSLAPLGCGEPPTTPRQSATATTVPANVGADVGAGSSTATGRSTTARLTVHVADLRNGRGQLLVGVYRSAEGFPSDRAKAVAWRSAPADGDGTFAFDLPAGRYAVGVLHDENGNGRMDTGLFGIPTEGYGVTNNPKPHRRAATFDEATLDLSAGRATPVTISVQYDFF